MWRAGKNTAGRGDGGGLFAVAAGVLNALR